MQNADRNDIIVDFTPGQDFLDVMDVTGPQPISGAARWWRSAPTWNISTLDPAIGHTVTVGWLLDHMISGRMRWGG